MTGYGKIFGSMFTGSMLGAGPVVFALISYVIAHVGRDSRLEINPDLLAAMIGCDVKDVESALVYLTSPDPKSRSEVEEGRRLLYEEGFTYFVVNYKEYREKVSKAQNAVRQQVYRDKQKATEGPKKAPAKKKTNTAADYTDAFNAFWEQTWRRGNKKAAFAAWEAIEDEDMNAIVAAACSWRVAFARREGGYVPHVSTWLNARGWEDDLDAELAKAKGAKGGFDPNVGATPKISEADRVRRRQQVRTAIVKHAGHLMKLELEDPEVAAIVQEGIEKLVALSETVCASEDAKELIEGFQAISDEMLLKISKGWDKKQREEWKKSALEHGKTKDAQHRMYNALARRAVTTGLGIKPITDYEWVG